MPETNNTALKRAANNVSQLGDMLKIEQSSAALHAISVQLEGYALVVRGYAMKASEEK